MKKGLAVLLILLMVILLCPDTGRMEESETCPFSVEPVLTSANIGDDGYHIAAGPGETVTLQAVLHNLTGHTLELYLTPLNAYSGAEGIFYQSPDQVDSQTAALVDEHIGLAQYISMEDQVMLIAGMSAILTVTITVPELDEGVLMGGVRVTVDGQSVDTAIQIDLPSEAALSVAAGALTITDQGISIPIINPSAAIAQNVSIVYEIRDNQRSIISEGDIVLPEMAPSTVYYILYPIEPQAWANDPYTLNMQVATDGRETDYVQTFVVGEANQIETVVPQGIKPEESAAERQKKEAVPTAESQQGTALSETTAEEQEAGLTTAAAEPQTPEGTIAGSADGLSRGVVSCVVFGIPAVFVVILLWMSAKNRKRGKHERPPWWQAEKREWLSWRRAERPEHRSWFKAGRHARPAEYRAGKHARPPWYRAGKHSPAVGIG